MPSSAESPAKGYTVWSDVSFRTGYRAEQLRMPWHRDVMVQGGQTTDLGDTFVLAPSFQSGNIRLAGPPADAGSSCLPAPSPGCLLRSSKRSWR